MVGAFRRKNSVPCLNGHVLAIGPHDALSLDEVIKLLMRVFSLVDMSTFADPRSQFPDCKFDW